ncbi:uncharacterized protein LOC134800227 isoform X1 [Cydia splendana]|uniref:uncharacterized protein LOC134800227 isoform X1 n=1 Tax=Cydia splendana TaxID=1100963 RepID=UPI00212AC538
MTESLKSNMLEITPRTIQEVRKEYNLDKPGMMDQAIDILHNWIQKQDHLVKKDFCRDYLERIIISTKGSVEKAKKRIDKVCTMRTMVPNLFEKIHAKNDFPHLQDFYINLNLPKITEDNYRIFIAKIGNKPLSPSVYLQAYQLSVLFCEYMKLYDYTLGYHVIYDMRDANILDVVTKMDLVDLRNVVSFYTDGYGFRIKGVYILSNSSIIGTFVDVLKQLVSAKIGQRICVCKTMEELYERVPKHLLPEDYGGEQKSVLTLYDEWIEEISQDKHVEYLKVMRGACTNEKLRRPDKFNDDYLGMPGSFKMLHVD